MIPETALALSGGTVAPSIHPRTENLTGRVIGNFTVLAYAGTRRYWGTKWLCRCVCGTEKIMWRGNLLGGKVKSCGCYRNRLAQQGLSAEEAIIRRVIAAYKKSAEKRGFAWNLNGELASKLLTANCSYCGAAPARRVNGMRGEPSFVLCSGIDRRDNSRGYDPDNAVSCCSTCNRAKWEQTTEEWLAWLRRIATHQGVTVGRTIIAATEFAGLTEGLVA